ncbi:MAG: glutamine synthetase family protein [Actinomycetia bacterium]|nr:glutamine synthetase family protein [Actinomycetes bacterium]
MTDQTQGAPLSIEELKAGVATGRFDTVILAITDMQGRLQGKRLDAGYFVDHVLAHGTEGCNYLLAVDVDMNTVDGYQMSSWDAGYGDFVMAHDLDTLRPISWHPHTAMVQADVQWLDGSDVVASPRQILKRQLAGLADAGMEAFVGTELEFILFNDSYEDAWARHYRDLTPSNTYNVDYSIIGTSRVEPLLRRIRLAMSDSGLQVESVKGECNLGQHEIAFLYESALKSCDNHVVYKTAAKEIAAQDGYSLTFMAKYNEREGNSCHIHLSFRGADGEMVMADPADAKHGMSTLGRQFIAGQLAHLRELSLLFAPNINSYKRFAPGSFAPTSIEWGRDNRTCALRLVGQGPGLRVENRIPGGDVNPYLAVAGMVAASLAGIDGGLELRDEFIGNAYQAGGERAPMRLVDAVELWERSEWVAETFGEEVQAHYANMGRIEVDAFDRCVTDWERIRSFERM